MARHVGVLLVIVAVLACSSYAVSVSSKMQPLPPMVHRGKSAADLLGAREKLVMGGPMGKPTHGSLKPTMPTVLAETNAKAKVHNRIEVHAESTASVLQSLDPSADMATTAEALNPQIDSAPLMSAAETRAVVTKQEEAEAAEAPGDGPPEAQMTDTEETSPSVDEGADEDGPGAEGAAEGGPDAQAAGEDGEGGGEPGGEPAGPGNVQEAVAEKMAAEAEEAAADQAEVDAEVEAEQAAEAAAEDGPPPPGGEGGGPEGAGDADVPPEGEEMTKGGVKDEAQRDQVKQPDGLGDVGEGEGQAPPPNEEAGDDEMAKDGPPPEGGAKGDLDDKPTEVTEMEDKAEKAELVNDVKAAAKEAAAEAAEMVAEKVEENEEEDGNRKDAESAELVAGLKDTIEDLTERVGEMENNAALAAMAKNGGGGGDGPPKTAEELDEQQRLADKAAAEEAAEKEAEDKKKDYLKRAGKLFPVGENGPAVDITDYVTIDPADRLYNKIDMDKAGALDKVTLNEAKEVEKSNHAKIKAIGEETKKVCSTGTCEEKKL